MRRICYLLIFPVVLFNCFQYKPATQTSLLTEPLITDRNDTIKENLPDANLTKWISQFDRKLLEHNTREILKKFVPAAGEDALMKENTALLPLSYCGVYAAISSHYPDFEYLQKDDTTTKTVHGGDDFYILTIDIGHGADPVASLDTALLTAVYKESIVLDNRLVGGIRWWKIAKLPGSTFIYRNTRQAGNQKVLQAALKIK